MIVSCVPILRALEIAVIFNDLKGRNEIRFCRLHRFDDDLCSDSSKCLFIAIVLEMPPKARNFYSAKGKE
jgi:hypothetical protein